MEFPSDTRTSMIPLYRCKTLHLVRHAQGTHNVADKEDPSSDFSTDHFDAHLTPVGWQQVDNFRKHVHVSGLAKKVELVIVSPLLRTMQTAVGIFGGESYMNGVEIKPLMEENAGESNRSAISSLNCPPFLAVELCREILGIYPWGQRRSITDYRTLFPAIDFSLIENDEDILWKADIKETDEELAARGIKFINWLWTRDENEIAVVSHAGFLFNLFKAFRKSLHPLLKEEIWEFDNCDIRSLIIVDSSSTGADKSATNYQGSNSSGRASEVAKPEQDIAPISSG